MPRQSKIAELSAQRIRALIQRQSLLEPHFEKMLFIPGIPVNMEIEDIFEEVKIPFHVIHP